MASTGYGHGGAEQGNGPHSSQLGGAPYRHLRATQPRAQETPAGAEGLLLDEGTVSEPVTDAALWRRTVGAAVGSVGAIRIRPCCTYGGGARRDGACQVGVGEVGAVQVGARERCVAGVDIGEVGTSEVGA